MKLIRVLFALACAFVVGSPLAASASSPAVQLSTAQRAAVDEVSQYMNSMQYLRGEFSQISPTGKLARGVFFISKPGKMRFEYAPPVPLMIISDGKWVMIKNKNKENGDAGPLSKTPLRIVLSNDVNLARDTNIISVEQADGLVTVTLEDKKDTFEGGQLILVYDQSRKALQQWVVIDAKGRRTTVTLENLVAGEKPDPKLFVVKFNQQNKSSKN
jgi:outer membrane lipoprotein-sorting protein